MEMLANSDFGLLARLVMEGNVPTTHETASDCLGPNKNDGRKHKQIMKNLGKTLALAGAVLLIGAGAQTANAQRGNFDPAQMQQMMMDNFKERLEPKDDAEWKIISERITKVTEARRGTQAFASGGGFGGGRGRGQGGQGGQAGDAAGAGGQGGRGRGGPFGAEPNADVEALRKAIEDKAPADQLKPLLAKVREARKAADAKLDSAQSELKMVLTIRQEAVALTMGLVK